MTDPNTDDSQPPDEHSPDASRSIHLEIEVPGSVEAAWTAVATGPGVSSWYVPHDIEPREGGAVALSFGPGMDVAGTVLAWDPPRRIVLGTGSGGMSFEFVVEAIDDSSCVVRLVNDGFGTGADADAHRDAMAGGWRIFLTNLALHLEHFAGRAATTMLPMAVWAGPGDDAWRRLLDDLGIPADVAVDDRIDVAGSGAPPLAGTVAAVSTHHIALLIDQPAPGTAFIAAEGDGDDIAVSIWSYLYGDDAATVAERDDARWRTWLGDRAATPDAST